MSPRKWCIFLLMMALPTICRGQTYPTFYGFTENLCGDFWFTGSGCSYMPPFHPYEFDIDWGMDKNPVIKVGPCGGVTPAKISFKLTGGPGVPEPNDPFLDPYDPYYDPWTWFQCDHQGNPESMMDCTGSPFLPYSWRNTYLVKCTPSYAKDPNQSTGEGGDTGQEDIFTYPACGTHVCIEISLKDDSCKTLRQVNSGDYVKVEVEIWRWVWVNRCCTEGDMASCLGYTYFCECGQGPDVKRMKGEMIEKKEVCRVSVEFTEGNPCK